MKPNDKALAFALISLCGTSMAWSAKGQFQLHSSTQEYEVVLHFKSELLPFVQPNAVHFAQPLPPSAAEALREMEKRFGIQYQPLFPLSLEQSARRLSPGVSEAPSTGIDPLQLAGMTQILSNAKTPKDYLELCQSFETLPQVAYCDLIPKGIRPPSIDGPPASPTQNWVSNQGYLNAAPQGIDAKWAWSQGITGKGVIAHDAEWAWNQSHEEFPQDKIKVGLVEPSEGFADHGTAVLGEIMAANNGFGMTGGAYDLDQMWTYSEVTGIGRTGAISTALSQAKAGDILILEMQTGGCHSSGGEGQYGPPDYNQSVWNLVKQATDAGILVVMAAGNGQQDLDNSCYASYRARGENGGIIVGASNAANRTAADFTSYGSSVDLHGWGDWSVYTTGYGSLFNGGPNSTYTGSFSGTSSATPIVASAMILVQSWAKANLGRNLNPIEMRELLVSTGTPQGADTRLIGPLPNVRAAIEKLMLGSSSSTGISSSSLSSSSLLSSSFGVSSSSSQQNNDCAGYPIWKSNVNYHPAGTSTADWVYETSTGANVQYNNSLYATWWANVGVQPGTNSDWTKVRDCRAIISSSSMSSSSQISSSSIITQILNQAPTGISWNTQGIFWPQYQGRAQIEIRRLNGTLVHQGSLSQGYMANPKSISNGVYTIRLKTSWAEYRFHWPYQP
jgi:hypothetical protein